MKNYTILSKLICSVTVAAVLSGMLVIPAHADNLAAVVDSSSTYNPTQIKNGGFEEIPFMTHMDDTNVKRTSSNIADYSYAAHDIEYHGVGEGWNTTETTTYRGNLFEWLSKTYYDNSNAKEGTYFIEQNTTNPATQYQDLTTYGGDVIRWSLWHRPRVGRSDSEDPASQSLKVEIGAPNGNATGIGTNINTNIKDGTKAVYTSNGVTDGKDKLGFAKDGDLNYLTVQKSDNQWRMAQGVYIVPDGQNVTRFAFVATSPGNGGNYLDDITFSTLIGNLHAQINETTGGLDVTGYWGETDSSKKLICKIGNTSYEINMSAICSSSNKNFSVTIPASYITGVGDIDIYHQDYPSAKRTVSIEHTHQWKYVASDNEIKAYCDKQESGGWGCAYYGEGNAKKITLTASDEVYSGNAYNSASFTNEITDLTGINVSAITYYKDENLTTKTTTADGAESEGSAPKNYGTYYAAVSVTDGTGTYYAKKSFDITKTQRPAGSMYVSVTSPITYGSKPTDLKVENEVHDAPVTTLYYSGTNTTDPAQATVWDNVNPPILDAGTYYFFATAEESGNYAAFTTAVKELKVEPKPIGVTWTNTELTYTGIEQGPTATFKEEDIVKSTDVVKINVSGRKINAGEYQATAASDNSNYAVKDSDKQKSYSIKKVELILYPSDQRIKVGKKILSDITAIKAKNLVNNEKLETVLGAGTNVKVVCDTSDYSAKGTYDLSIDTGSASPVNYTIKTQKGKLTVTDDGSSTKIDPENPDCGDVYTETIKEEGLPEMQISSLTKESAEKLLGQADAEKVRSGSDALIYLDLSDATKKVKQTSGVVDKFKNKKSPDMILYENTFLDLSLYKKIMDGTSQPEKLTDLGTDVSITVEIPAELMNVPSGYSRVFEVIRRHIDSSETESYDKIQVSYSNGKITFKTNKFSEYALAYKDVKNSTPPAGGGDDGGTGGGSGSSNSNPVNQTGIIVTPVYTTYGFVSPKTSDTMAVYGLAALMLAGVAIVLLPARKKK